MDKITVVTLPPAHRLTFDRIKYINIVARRRLGGEAHFDLHPVKEAGLSRAI